MKRAAPNTPASTFSVVLGVAGLANSWRAASALWVLPAKVGEVLGATAVTIWIVLLVLYAAHWIQNFASAADELRHPVKRSYVGLLGVATLLSAQIVGPYSHAAGDYLFFAGAFFSIFYAIWQTGGIWRSSRHHDAATAALYLPAVAGSFVTATTASALGHGDWSGIAFGAGIFSWLAIESVVAHRLFSTAELPLDQRATLGIQFAPPAVGGVAYMSMTAGAPDLFALALLGYALLQLAIVARLLRWIFQVKFGLHYWAFTFGSASLASMLIKMASRGHNEAVALLAPAAFLLANALVAAVAAGTILIAVGASMDRLRSALTRLRTRTAD